MGKLMDHTSRIVQVEHIRVWTGTPFAEVVRRIEAETGVFAPVAAMRARIEAKAPPGSVIEDIAAMAGRSGLMRFAALDHGAILRLQGKPTVPWRSSACPRLPSYYGRTMTGSTPGFAGEGGV
jgi:hypothetical protein